jgi:membrane protein DedA with SNARE-associated domain
MPNIYFALICYISTALATVFLFLTVFVFAQAIPMVSKSVSAILDCAFFSVLLILCYFSNRLRRREKSNMIRLCFTISIPLLLIGVSYTAINVIASFIGVSLPVLAYHIYITSMFGWIVLVLIILLANYKSRKKKKKS